MDIELQQRLRLKKVELVVKEKDSMVIRRCKMTFESPVDGLLAASLGADAVIAHQRIVGGGFGKVEIPIDAIECEANLVGDRAQVRLPTIRGIKAVMKAGTAVEKDEEEEEESNGNGHDEPPLPGERESAGEEPDAKPVPVSTKAATIQLQFEASYSDELWLFLGKTCAAWADVHLTKSQLELPLSAPAQLRSVGNDDDPATKGLAF